MSQSALLKSKRFLPFFVTQFLGAFNDNIFKNTLMLLIIFAAADAFSVDINTIINLAALLFILPFFLFSSIAGQITDKVEKSALIRKVKLLEIGIMVVAAIGFIFEFYYLLLALLFLMGTQSTIFGPAKYSIIPQHLKANELVGGNALVEMGTFVAILLGQIGAGLIMGFDARVMIVSTSVVILAILGYLACRQIPEAPAAQPDLKINFNPITTTIEQIKLARSERGIYLAIVAISWFWFIGACYLTNFPNFTKIMLNGDASVVTLLLAIFTIGVALGSMACEKLSGSRVDLGIVPIGALGLTIFGIDMYFSIPDLPAQAITWSQFLNNNDNWRLMVDLAGIGVSGGVFIVPLYAYVQQKSPEAIRARMIAVINIMNALFMVMSAIAGIVFIGNMGLDIIEFFLVISIMNIVVCLYVFYQVDEFAIRFVVWMLSHTMYRVRHEGLDNIPEEGAAVIVCNHVSYVDALLLAGASPRPIRFVMDHNIFKNKFLGWFFRTVNAIPIAPQHKDEKCYTDAFDKVSEYLSEGHLVCIFPEGKLTKTGDINEFKSGIDKILERDPVPVIPMALQGLWGSFFSHKDGTAFTTLPKRFWSKVKIVASQAIPAEEASADVLFNKVSAMRGEVK